MADIDTVKKSLIRKKSADANPIEFGKLPPQARELEEAVLGALLIDTKTADEVIGLLNPDMFYVDAHQRIYQAIVILYEQQEPIDLLTVTEQLKKNGELDASGGPFYIAQLTNKVGSSANAEYHARVLVEKYLQRRIIATNSENIRDAYEDTTDVFELIDRVQQSAFALTENNNGNNEISVQQAIGEEIEECENPSPDKGGITTGFKNIDRIVPGFANGENIVIAARPGMGKTAFVLQLARMIGEKKPVAFFSLEMQSSELAKRLLAAESGVLLDHIIRRKLNEDERLKLRTAQERLRQCNIIIDDTASQRPLQLLSACRKLKSTHDIAAVFIDYMQLIDAYDSQRKFDSTDAEVSYISKTMKRIAKTIDVPVFVLSQLNRDCEKRPDKRPMLSDLRNSGSIEQDADKVIFLYRDEYYGITENKHGQDSKGLCEVILAKQRNGALDTAILNFDGKHQKFSDR